MEKMKLPFVDSDLLYTGVLKAGLTVFAKEENIKYLQVYQFIQQ